MIVNIQVNQVNFEELSWFLEALKNSGGDPQINVTVSGPFAATDDPPLLNDGTIETLLAIDNEVSPALSDATAAMIGNASPEDRALLTRFITGETQEREAVGITGPRDKHLYVRLYAPGSSQRGAYCYVTHRAYVDFRLPKEEAQGCLFAYAREVRDGGTPYAVRLRLNSEAALQEARRLAARAARRVQVGSTA